MTSVTPRPGPPPRTPAPQQGPPQQGPQQAPPQQAPPQQAPPQQAPPAPRPVTSAPAPVPLPPPDESPTEMLPAGRHARPRRTRAETLRKVRGHLAFLAVMVVVAVAFGRIGLQHWREGTTELGLALLLAGVLRASLTRTAAGLLAVRSRRVDIVTYVLFGLVMIAVSLTITGGPLAYR
ncbi:DUF3017 domain-containing protein [Actinomycetospora straminea]|uniref:DUF3017 domain-containing protein n=1 Tax=Actinomycetospora straminea TaxID=663607 RepID=UPI002366A43D|nr:DUF3017 domain-containing protein [Actinomycetospora straminea]MDD7931172.1 DUF3017 domain-containing protein [Actinomycetospora straminea]